MINEKNYMTSYENIFFDIKCQIINGYLKSGDKLPSIEELCKIYNASNITIKDSIKMLKQHGYVKSIERVGNYVNEKKILQYKFEINEIDCLKQKPDRNKIIRIELVNGDMISDEIPLRIANSYYYVKIEQIHYFGELPMMYNIFWLIHSKKINVEKLNKSNWIHTILGVLNNFEIVKDLSLTVKNNLPEMESILFLPKMAPMFEITKKYYTKKNAAVGFSRHYAACDDMDIKSI